MKANALITHDEIAPRAHDIWEAAGRPVGKETEHWLRAERELRAERRQAGEFARSDRGARRGEAR